MIFELHICFGFFQVYNDLLFALLWLSCMYENKKKPEFIANTMQLGFLEYPDFTDVHGSLPQVIIRI